MESHNTPGAIHRSAPLSTREQLQIVLGLTVEPRHGLTESQQAALDEARQFLIESGALPPWFEHDCTSCVPLGRYLAAPDVLWNRAQGRYDLYYCTQGGTVATVIARAGDDPSDYASGTRSSHPVLIEAERRARVRGLRLGILDKP